MVFFDIFTDDQYMVAISIDLEKAIYHLWRLKMLFILEEWNIKGNLANFNTQFLLDQKFQVRVDDLLSPVHNPEKRYNTEFCN